MPRARLWCAAALSGSLAALILPIASGAENWDAWSSRRQDRLLIYTVGKTGSETLQQSLEAFTGQPVPYFHGEKGEILNRIGARKQVGVKCHKFEAAREFRDAAKKSRLWTVALVRNPFDREASAFFQNFDRHASGPCGTTKHDFDSIKAVFDKCRLGLSEDDAAFYPKFRKLTHVTLLDHASTVRENRTLRLYGVSGPVLLLRLEDMKSWATSLQPFFHNASFGHRNSADNADLYETFKRRYRYGIAAAAKMVDSPTMKFYDDNETIALLQHHVDFRGFQATNISNLPEAAIPLLEIAFRRASAAAAPPDPETPLETPRRPYQPARAPRS